MAVVRIAVNICGLLEGALVVYSYDCGGYAFWRAVIAETEGKGRVLFVNCCVHIGVGEAGRGDLRERPPN